MIVLPYSPGKRPERHLGRMAVAQQVRAQDGMPTKLMKSILPISNIRQMNDYC